MKSVPEQIIHVAKLAFERRLTDIAGGNISIRAGDQITITPRYAGNRWHWDLSPSDLVIGSVFDDDLMNNPSLSREGLSHLAVYRAFPMVKGIIHAHPFNILPFCAAEKPMPLLLQGVQKYGTLKFIRHAPNYSQDQADSIIENFRGQEQRMEKAAAAVLLPQHGIFIAGSDLYNALDALERFDTNAWCILSQKLIP